MNMIKFTRFMHQFHVNLRGPSRFTTFSNSMFVISEVKRYLQPFDELRLLRCLKVLWQLLTGNIDFGFTVFDFVLRLECHEWSAAPSGQHAEKNVREDGEPDCEWIY